MKTSKHDIRTRSDELAPSRNFWLKQNRYYYEDQKKYFKFLIPEDRSVLELGCGTGWLLASMKPKRGLGIDISPHIIEQAEKDYPDLEFKIADLEMLDCPDETFDFIILSDTIGLLMDVENTLHNLHRFCTSATRIVISYYNFLWEPLLKLGERIGQKMPQQQQNWLSIADITNLLYLADFQIIKKERRLLFPKNIPVLSTFINRYIAP
ncbi:MAG: class I SAM-dependent methyltransferase, partial [Deltaproteobacteria bacterium]|nr:class I SAM-dependent methyltransferase [Deltaproteobacteria bacterium]